MIEIVNVVSGGDLHQEIDLDTLADNLSVYSIDRKDSGLFIKIDDGSPLTIVYRTGKYVITGANSMSDSRLEKEKFVNMLYDIGIEVAEPSFDIYNIVYKGDLGKEYDLLKIQFALGFEQVEYEPEQSPFLIYRPNAYDCVMTISSSGKSVISGVKSPSVAEDAFQHTITLLNETLE